MIHTEHDTAGMVGNNHANFVRYSAYEGKPGAIRAARPAGITSPLICSACGERFPNGHECHRHFMEMHKGRVA